MEQGHKCASYFVSVDVDESFQRPVIGPFHIIREKAGRELSHTPMILKTITADSLATAWFVGAVAVLEIIVFLTFFHDFLHQSIDTSVFRGRQTCQLMFWDGLLYQKNVTSKTIWG
jgi:hypothetical protein